MKIIKMKCIFFLLAYSFFTLPYIIFGQDSIRVVDIQKFSYPFDIEDGVFVGEGAGILTKAISNAHIVMLGNNSRNQQEADLDLALSEFLHQNDYRTLITEYGPALGDIADRLSDDASQTVETFRSINQKYYFEAGGLQFMPIPDLKYVGGGQLIEYVKENDWTIGGIGTDSWTGFKLIIDEMYNNLSAANKLVHQKEYNASVVLLDRLYGELKGQTYDDIKNLTVGLKASEDFNKFLEEMNTFTVNNEIYDAIQFSIDYWWMYGNQEGYKKNKLNDQRNRVLMKEALKKSNFDFGSDKLFLKMWHGHLTKSKTRNGFYCVGGMLREMADYHGNNSLVVCVLSRYTMDDEKLIDAMDSDLHPIYEPFIAQGQQDDWVLIDLRPFTEVFYWGNYVPDLWLEKMMDRYDMILIPKTDSKAKVNN